MIKNIISKYRGYAAMYDKAIEDHLTAAGNEYLKGYSKAIKDITADIEAEAKNGRNLPGLALRIYNTDEYGIRDAMDAGPAGHDEIIGAIAADLQDVEKCHDIIDYLLNMIEEAQA